MHHLPANPPPDLEPTVIHPHPLAYLLGLQGVALFRSFNGEYDLAYAEARIAEVRALLHTADEIGGGVDVPLIPTAEAYDGWAPLYDGQRNLMLEREQAVVHPILATLPVGVALDVACGTGRHAAYLQRLGHSVIGVDASRGMLAVVRAKLPDAELHLADWHALPVPDDHVDVVTCGIALTHVRELGPVFAEFARVLKPGGHLVVSDSRGLMDGAQLYPMVFEDRDGNPGFMRAWVHPTVDYLRAALPLGLHVRACEEYVADRDMVDATGTEFIDDEPVQRWTARHEPPSIWELHPWAPAATNAVFRTKPSFIAWHFQLTD
ncbi:MAG: class I SAM-dependent methyltransferase [Actinomycetota bacterium]|jgi:ubiquinone/menaquinone biosynthesis C-methylase UbiE|nr:class I SAM-dependent methyltransferase [Actinomycetota bacterium]